MKRSASVTVAYVHDAEVAHSFHDSLINLLMLDAANEGRVLRGGYIAMRYGTGGIIAARNRVAEQFLERDDDWLLIIDTDMGFRPDSLEQLLTVADPVNAPIVGGLCFAQREVSSDGLSGYACQPRVTIFDWVGEGFQGRAHYPVNSVVRCAATGAAFILIHRSVLERIRAEMGPVWYDRITGADGTLFGEDMSFCMRAGALDVPVHVHTGVRTSHLKNVWLGEHDYWTALVAPPATDQTRVVVPVRGRPEHADPFMQSLRASTGLAAVTAVAHVDDQDTITAWKAAGADVLTVTEHSFASKCNTAYAATTEPWLFLTGSDVRFHPGWLDQAQHIARTEGATVVGTNDLGNPRVIAGEHATHMLVSRAYVDEHGASWDGPGVVCHDGYRHWYVDDELVTVAKQRGVWAMALGSVVEHLHPAWGKAPTDEVYELGQATSRQDYARFMQRCATYT